MNSAALNSNLDGLSRLSSTASQTGKVDAAVVWLHGLGADGHDFEPIVPVLQQCNQLAIRFVFPHAPVQPVTINNGVRMRAWYDIRSVELTGARDLDEAGMQASCTLIEELLQQLKREHQLSDQQLILAGFSQGGVIALQAGLAHSGLADPTAPGTSTNNARLGGIIGLSCYLPARPDLSSSPAARATPIFMAHGNVDPMVPLSLGQQAATWLQELGLPLTWQTYPVAHGVLPEELAAVDSWIAARIKSAHAG